MIARWLLFAGLELLLSAVAVALAAREVPEMSGFFTDGCFRPAAVTYVGVAISLR